jgi:hypothetical protein
MTQTTFDYDILDAHTRELVQRRTDEIKRLTKPTAQDVVEIGEKLIEVKEALGHGHFEEWLRAEFEWTSRTARRFMAVAETFKSDNLSDLTIALSALYLFASPSTPASAREEALDRAREGEPITHATAKAIRGVHTQPDIEDFPDVLTRTFTVARETEKWVKTTYQRTMTLKGAHTAQDVASALNAEQLEKISAMIEFLREVEQLYHQMNFGGVEDIFNGDDRGIGRF